MRELWARVGALLSADDPDTGRLARALMTLLLGWSLSLELDGPAPVWAALSAAMALWLAYLVLGARGHHNLSLAALALSSVVSASAAGAQGPTVFVFVTLLLFAAQLAPRLWMILAVAALDLALLLASLAWWQHSRASMISQGAVLVVTVLFALQRRQYRRAQQDRARAMALDERARIARELHDVLAHSLGALGVHLEVAEAMLVEKGDVAGAAERIRRARGLAREGLVEARSAVAALRQDIPPLPDALHAMVEQHRRDHAADTRLAASGARRPLSPAAEVCLLRTAREALTNAARHAPGERVTVALDYGERTIRLTVRNPLPERTPVALPSGGHGLTGMRERLALAGGTLEAGPVEGWWQVRAEVPE
ncbi:sensor histidine kinase [Nonomuraea sp. NPDC050328]|uniref:sensor histidine kinase n=1 Tax=Nonomuraea sp. NPDC050328 TaxID=3364361 RepID=UPI0037AA5902